MSDRIYMKNHVIIILVFMTICFYKLTNAATYNYDNLHRLTRVVYVNGTVITYSYDEVGNRTRRVSTLQADSSIDGTVNFNDFTILASRWMEEYCGYTDEWCEGADIDWNTEVGIEDLVILAQQWLSEKNP